jgi:Rrf2 family iron-sulfur cluster assembly transcriptional regulator
MRLTTKGRYAVTAMLDLALNAESGPVSLADIAARQGISLSYLEQLFARLRKQRLVHSSRGPGGGYQISRLVESITVAQIIEAVDESVDATQCRNQGHCLQGEQCLTHDLWAELTGHIQGFLAGVSLAGLAADARRRQSQRGEQVGEKLNDDN